jgi:pimeloyl-ACP methyl ester carboxylesterase
MTSPLTFVLVHGAWHGGWCWRHIAEILRTRGHAVTTPTQTGLGERSHLLLREITLSTFVADIENHILFEDLNNVVLVGHSFAGSIISGVADRMAERIDRLIYLDALMLQSGETPMSRVPEDIAAERIRLAEEASGGLAIPAPPASAFGVTDPGQAAWVGSLLTPHPLNTYLSNLTFDNPLGNGLPADYIVCADPLYLPLEDARNRTRQLGWPMHDLPTGHDAMVSAPQATADLVEAIAAG